VPPDLPDDVSYEPATGTYRAEFDWSARAPSLGVARVIDAAADAVRVDPLAESVDPDSVDRLLGVRHPAEQDEPLRLRFVHDGFEVFTDRSGVVEVRPCSTTEADRLA
jgi:hypothetical protein